MHFHSTYIQYIYIQIDIDTLYRYLYESHYTFTVFFMEEEGNKGSNKLKTRMEEQEGKQ